MPYRTLLLALVLLLFASAAGAETDRELRLADYGFASLERNPSSFSPFLDGRHLFLGPDGQMNVREISKFSKKDADKLGVEVSRLASSRVSAGDRSEPTPMTRTEAAMDSDPSGAALSAPLGPPSGFVCPDCSGALFVVAEKPVLRFRCRIGGAWRGSGKPA